MDIILFAMNKQNEISKLMEMLQSLSVKEIKAFRQQLSKKVTKKSVPKRELERLVKQNKSTQAIALHFRLSPRTITRRIREYDLTGQRPLGRKPRPKKPRKPRVKREWIGMKRYYYALDKQYRFVNVNIPPRKWINPRTLVASNTKGNPADEYTTVGLYYIIKQSDVYLLYALSIRYTSTSVPFDHIYNWMRARSFENVGKRVYLKKEEEIQFITAMNKKLKKRVPYQRYNKPVKARIKTVIKEEPIKLAQSIRNKNQKYQPHIMKYSIA